MLARRAQTDGEFCVEPSQHLSSAPALVLYKIGRFLPN